MWAYQNMFYQIQRKCLALGWLYVCAFLPPLLRTVPRKSLNNSTKFYHLVVQSKRVYTYSKSNDDGILQNLKELDYLLLSEKLPAALSFMQNDVMLWSNTIHAISIVCHTVILFLTLWLAAGLSEKKHGYGHSIFRISLQYDLHYFLQIFGCHPYHYAIYI